MSYLDEIEPAVTALLEIIITETERYVGAMEEFQETAQALNQSKEITEKDENSTPYDIINYIKYTFKVVENAKKIKGESLPALCGALLQIARQGIGTLKGAQGRIVVDYEDYGPVCLRNYIWYARNQAMHYESKFHGPTAEMLPKIFNRPLELCHNQNLSLFAINDLGWTKFSDFANDLKELGVE